MLTTYDINERGNSLEDVVDGRFESETYPTLRTLLSNQPQ